jgi:hypothetical protein
MTEQSSNLEDRIWSRMAFSAMIETNWSPEESKEIVEVSLEVVDDTPGVFEEFSEAPTPLLRMQPSFVDEHNESNLLLNQIKEIETLNCK